MSISFLILDGSFEKKQEKELIEKVNKFNIFKSKDDLQSGILPDSFKYNDIDGTYYLVYGFEKPHHSKELDKENETIIYHNFNKIVEIPIAIINNGFIIIGRIYERLNKDLKERIKVFIEKNIIKGYIIDVFGLEDNFIRFLENSHDLRRLSVQPSQPNNRPIEDLGAKAKGDIKDTEFYDETQDDLRNTIQISVEIKNMERWITFHRRGIISLPRNLNPQEILTILNLISESIATFSIPRGRTQNGNFSITKYFKN